MAKALERTHMDQSISSLVSHSSKTTKNQRELQSWGMIPFLIIHCLLWLSTSIFQILIILFPWWFQQTTTTLAKKVHHIRKMLLKFIKNKAGGCKFTFYHRNMIEEPRNLIWNKQWFACVWWSKKQTMYVKMRLINFQKNNWIALLVQNNLKKSVSLSAFLLWKLLNVLDIRCMLSVV